MKPLPGLNAMAYQPATETWEGEPDAAAELERLFTAVNAAIKLDTDESCTEAIRLLDEITASAPKLNQVTSPSEILRSALPPSLEMRRLAAYGHALSGLGKYDAAYACYDMAQSIATEQHDLPSQIELHRLCGLMRYGDMRFYEALPLRRAALALWRDHIDHVKQSADALVEQEVTLCAEVGEILWNIGQFDDAQAILARTLTLTMQQSGERRSPYLRRQTAGALWTLMLVLRCQSDMLDGDMGLIRTALRRAKTAARLFQSVRTPPENLARFKIQVAELYLDLAEIHQDHGAHNAARQARRLCYDLIIQIVQIQEPLKDQPALGLVDIVFARHEILRYTAHPTATSAQEITGRLSALRTAAESSDRFVAAKVACVYAEWLILRGEDELPRLLLKEAIEQFNQSGAGMATRAHRLLRRMNAGPPPTHLGHRTRRRRQA